jgi:hypothetical protein
MGSPQKQCIPQAMIDPSPQKPLLPTFSLIIESP